MSKKENDTIVRETQGGKRILGMSLTKQGDLIGDILYFTKKESLWSYAIALEDSELIEVSCDLFSKDKKGEGGSMVLSKVNYEEDYAKRYPDRFPGEAEALGLD